MKVRYYRPVALECIEPAFFPDIALFVRINDNYTLYKPHDVKFTENDRTRLTKAGTNFLYLRVGDMEEFTEYLEGSLAGMLSRDDVSREAKGKILFQTMANHVAEIFDAPEKAASLTRCRILIRHFIKYLTTDKDVMKALQSIIANNYYIFSHSVQVTALSLLAHQKIFNITRGEMVDVGVGSILHDFGMIFISNDILDKPDAISEVEYYIVKKHAQKGYEYMKEMGALQDVPLTIIRHHHEKYDGSGYPCGLKGEDIPRSAQLTALCDVFCALTADRVYAKANSMADALRIMRDEMPGAFNKTLFERFEEIVAEN